MVARPPRRPPLSPGFRLTEPRRLVWEAMQRLGAHCTAEEIAVHLEERGAGVHRSTVYRALDALVASGAVRPVHLGSGPVHYEEAGEEHLHAVCQRCHCILHLEHHLTEDLIAHLEQEHWFRPVRTEVLVLGVCHACAHSRVARPPRPGRRRTVGHLHPGE